MQTLAVCLYEYICACTHVCMYVCWMYEWMKEWMNEWTNVCVCMSACTFACLSIYISVCGACLTFDFKSKVDFTFGQWNRFFMQFRNMVFVDRRSTQSEKTWLENIFSDFESIIGRQGAQSLWETPKSRRAKRMGEALPMPQDKLLGCGLPFNLGISWEISQDGQSVTPWKDVENLINGPSAMGWIS